LIFALIAAECDKSVDEVKKKSFVAKLSTFEADLMNEYHIKEDRVRAKTYVY
jgi:hypothetical protein